MWHYNKDLLSWSLRKDTLEVENYRAIRQSLEATRLYAKCFSGALWQTSRDLENLFPSIQYLSQTSSWHFSTSSGSYSLGFTTSLGSTPITSDSFTQYYHYNEELGFSNRGYFSPNSAIRENITPVSVDLATTTHIDNLLGEKPSLLIDGVFVKEGQTILVKDQKTEVGLSASVDTSLFSEIYYLISDEGVDKKWFYYNSQNGIYKYTSGLLVKEPITSYTFSKGLLIDVKSGSLNRDKYFTPRRFRTGYYPLEGENFEFSQTPSYLIKNKFEYNNLFEVGYNDIIRHTSLTIGSYSIPERVVSVGDFGTILLYESGTSSLIPNKISTKLTSIENTKSYYWICGRESTLLKIDKVTLEVSYIELDSVKNFTSISFFSDLYGCLVGEFGEIWLTGNGGLDWTKLELETINNQVNLNRVLFYNISEIYIIGDSGTFLTLIETPSGWQVSKVDIFRQDSAVDTYTLTPHLRDFIYLDITGWTLSSQKRDQKELLLITSDSDNLFVWNKNNFATYSFLVLESSITNLSARSLTNIGSQITLAGRELYSFDLKSYDFITTSNTNVLRGPTYSKLSDLYINRIKSWNNAEFLVASNYSTSKSYDSASFSLITDYAKLYTDTISSRFLILNYDLASKVNFHDYLGNYRLPVSTTISVVGFTLSDVTFATLPGQTSWIDYWKNTLLTFEYYTSFSSSNVVEISTIFNYSGATNSFFVTDEGATPSLTEQNIDPDTSLIYIKKLVPTVKFDRDSYYVEGSDPIDINFATSYNCWIGDFVIVFKLVNVDFDGSLFKKGDILNINSTSISANLMINKIFRYMSSNPTPIFLYCYHNFSSDIISSLRATGFSVKNLNVFSSAQDFVNNFSLHPLSVGYEIGLTQSQIKIEGHLNNKTAYYNLAQNIIHDSTTYSFVYGESFFDFGYTPTYNIYDFLSRIDPVSFTSSKFFGAMPRYQNIPALDVDLDSSWTSSSNLILCDDTKLSNRLVFGKNLKFEWESIWINTFVDVVVKTSNYGDFLTEKCLVEGKKYLPEKDSYIVEFNKPINRELLVYNQLTSINFVNILSRNSLLQISSDLQELNNINRNLNTKQIQWPYTFDVYQNEITQKFPTDSYCKILLSDPDIKSNITSIIWEDSRSKLSNVLINPLGDDLLKILPVDLSRVGSDRGQKDLVELSPNNYRVTSPTASLVNVDMNKLRFRFTDGLTLSKMLEKYSWIVESEVSDGLVGEDSNGLIFYSGIWRCGRWFSGTWYSGQWLAGDWYGGVWNSNWIKTRGRDILVDSTQVDTQSLWYSGRWFDGTWNGGTWLGGRKYLGTWNGGLWNSGIWNDGVWNGGQFRGGIWVSGLWNSGLFNTDVNPSYWLDGQFRGGDFENGRWFDGQFSQYSRSSRFGTRASGNSKAIWETGEWISGEFFSGRQTDSSGNNQVSDIHRWSQFKSGNWASGQFWGGIVLNMNFSSGTFWGGIVDDIEIIGLTQSSGKMQFLLNGIFRFKYPYDIRIYAMFGSGYSSFGTIENPKKYLVTFSEVLDTGETLIQIAGSYSFTPTWRSYTDLRIVSHFENAEFKSGLWYNGIFLGNNFEGGMWYGGHFNGNFGI
jgi:hypothetical protein